MSENKQGLWARLRSPSARFSVLALLGFGFLGGVIVVAAVLGELRATATESFCISCHEMQSNLYTEYQNTAHYNTRSGMRATCPDCHLAVNLVPMMVRKVKAVREFTHKVKGTIDTREKFEAHRLKLAQRVWDEMKGNDSRECRSCHDIKAMDFAKQSRRARQQHIRGEDENLTCIECHKGIAHILPDMRDIDPSAVIGPVM